MRRRRETRPVGSCVFCDAPDDATMITRVIDGQPATLHAYHVEGIRRPTPTHPFTPNRWNPERCERCEEKRERHAA